jgi:hypothetical protein
MTSRRDTATDYRRPMATRGQPERGRPPSREHGGRRLSPGLIFLAVAIVLSVVYAVYAVTVRDTSQIPLLASGAVVLGIVFGAASIYALVAVWRSGVEGRGGRALGIAVVGGIAAIIAAGCIAGAIVLFMLAGN